MRVLLRSKPHSLQWDLLPGKWGEDRSKEGGGGRAASPLRSSDPRAAPSPALTPPPEGGLQLLPFHPALRRARPGRRLLLSPSAQTRAGGTHRREARKTPVPGTPLASLSAQLTPTARPDSLAHAVAASAMFLGRCACPAAALGASLLPSQPLPRTRGWRFNRRCCRSRRRH